MERAVDELIIERRGHARYPLPDPGKRMVGSHPDSIPKEIADDHAAQNHDDDCLQIKKLFPGKEHRREQTSVALKYHAQENDCVSKRFPKGEVIEERVMHFIGYSPIRLKILTVSYSKHSHFSLESVNICTQIE